MTIIEIQPLSNGAHRNQTSNTATVPDGWAILPPSLETPNFPFGTIYVDDSTPPRVTGWTAVEIPEPEPEPDPDPTEEEDLAALAVDHEYRLTLLELGLN